MALLTSLTDAGFSISFLTGDDQRTFRASSTGVTVFVPDSLIEQDPQGRAKLDLGVTEGLWSIDLDTSVKVEVVPGTNAAALALASSEVASVIAVLAFVAASGAPAAKTLLEGGGTDYTLTGGQVVTAGDETLNNLLVVYTV